MPGPVVIVDYDPKWPSLYEAEKRRILRIIGPMVHAVEHIGSTSVPGLCAKPIVDIMAGVQDSKVADDCVTLVERIGYTDVIAQPGHTEWFYCLGKGRHSVGYHLHLVKQESRFFEDHILFRNCLRKHPEVSRRYCELKRELATRYREDRRAYNDAKTTFIQSVLSDARRDR